MNTTRNLFCCWFGDNMSEQRRNCFKSIVRNSKVQVHLITESNLSEYIPDPHSGFKYLSCTHKSDYVRCYMMYHYGGGYTDIKYCDYDWNIYFDKLEASDKEFLGSRELKASYVGYEPATSYYNELVVTNQFIFKKGTVFAEKWFNATHNVMDNIYPVLVDNPGTYHPRAVTGGVGFEPGLFTDSKYPLDWVGLIGHFHRLQFENLGNWEFDLPSPNITNYR